MDTSIYVGGGSVGGGGIAQAVNMGGGGGGLAQMNAFSEEIQRAHKRTNVTIEQVENGYYVSINNKRFVCTDPQEVSERIIAEMVASKMEK